MYVLGTVPCDIWRNILSFLSRDELRNLYTVNRSFFEIAIVARYQVITFSKVNKGTKRLCAILSDDALGRGDLVHRVDIKPWLIQPRAKPPRTYHERVSNAVLNLFHPRSNQRRVIQQSKKRMQKDIARVSDAVRGLKKLTEYSLSWDEACPYELKNYQAFLSPVLTQISNRIVKLSLNIPTESLRSLALVSMPGLEQFELSLCTLKMPRQEIEDIFDHLTVFLNNLDRTLQSLSLSSRQPSQKLDLTRLLTNLGTFPRLQRFALTIPFEGRNLSSPSNLVTFLERHRDTLQHLQLGANRCCSADSPTSTKSKDWIYNIIAATTGPYPRLSGIQLALRPLKADLIPIIRFLRQQAGQLEYLSLTDRALQQIEVEAIIDGIGMHALSQLRRFHVRLCHLSSALLYLLASRLPRLTVLELTFAEVKASAAPVDRYAGNFAVCPTIELELFKEEIRGNRANYANWELRTIGISYGRSNQWLHKLSPTLLDVIPALQDVVQLPPFSDY